MMSQETSALQCWHAPMLVCKARAAPASCWVPLGASHSKRSNSFACCGCTGHQQAARQQLSLRATSCEHAVAAVSVLCGSVCQQPPSERHPPPLQGRCALSSPDTHRSGVNATNLSEGTKHAKQPWKNDDPERRLVSERTALSQS